MKGKDQSEDLGTDGKMIRMDLMGVGREGVAGINLVRIDTCGESLGTR
jgi:hypothetical protein